MIQPFKNNKTKIVYLLYLIKKTAIINAVMFIDVSSYVKNEAQVSSVK